MVMVIIEGSPSSRWSQRGSPSCKQLYTLNWCICINISCGNSILCCGSTVSFHNFKSQNFKLSVSNPKNKHVAYLSVLSQISNCQGLGRKNEHEILKTDCASSHTHTSLSLSIYICSYDSYYSSDYHSYYYILIIPASEQRLYEDFTRLARD